MNSLLTALLSPTPSTSFTPLWSGDLAAAAPEPFAWLWQGFLAPGNVTPLTSRWKAGKTTLVSILVSRMGAGGALAGLPLAAGRAVVVTEESPAQWQQRSGRLDFGNHVCWICRPFAGLPRRYQWLDFLSQLTELCRHNTVALVVIDPLAAFLPGHSENDAAAMMDALVPLQSLKALGVSILLSHHPRKKASAPGLAARGSGALSGYADVLIEMHPFTSATTDRRRRLEAFSRYDDTPRDLVIELNADGNDYTTHGDASAAEFSSNWDLVRAVLECAPGKLTRSEILASWPETHPAPAEVTLSRWLERAVGLGALLREGSGHRNDPYRYGLAGRRST
ncbi:MAG TPA: AAA family ATPase [Gemmataceae bacterium]|nr:AAA family ATPase [Gemmataceae bacterium]